MTTKPRAAPRPAKLPELETERLWLRQWSLADLDAIIAMDRDPEVYRFLEEPARRGNSAPTRERILTDSARPRGVVDLPARGSHPIPRLCCC